VFGRKSDTAIGSLIRRTILNYFTCPFSHLPLRPREDEGVAISRICFKGILVEKQVGRMEKMGESFKIFVLFGFSSAPASADKERINEHKWVPPSHRSRFSRRKISLLDICKKFLRRFFFRPFAHLVFV